MAYTLIRWLARLLLAIFYRRVEVTGGERVPAEGAVIVVANHHNALVDALLLIASLPRRLVPVAKAPLFRHPIVAPFLRLAGAIPVHRPQEAGSGKVDNARMFERARRALRRGCAIMLFPEGVSQPEPVLMPLRTGAARLALDAAAQGMAVSVIPVGLVVREPGTLRAGDALVAVGVAIAVTPPAIADDPAAVRALTDRIARGLRGLVVEARNRQTLRLLRLARTIWRQESGEATGRGGTADVAWMRAALETYAASTPERRARAERLGVEIERYGADLEAAGIEAVAVNDAYRPSTVLRYAAREGASLAAGLPVALWGMIAHAVPYFLTRWVVAALRPDPDAEATFKLAAGLVLYPLGWIAEAWVVARVAGSGTLIVFLLALLPTGFLALGWQQRLQRVRRDRRAFLAFLLHRDLHARLLVRRRLIMNELVALADPGGPTTPEVTR